MCHARAGSDRTTAPRASPRASPSLTAASMASRCRAASPKRRRGGGAVPRRAIDTARAWCCSRLGEQCTYADMYEWQLAGRPPDHVSALAASSRAASHREPLARHERGLADGAEVWPQVTPRPLTMQFTMSDAYSLNTGAVFGEAPSEGESSAADRRGYRDPELNAEARARGRRSRALTDEAAVGHVRGVGVGALPRVARAAGGRHRTRAPREPARRDVRARAGREPRDALPGLHRQRRGSRRSGAPADPRATWFSGSPTPARTSTSCATRRSPPTCSVPGCATEACDAAREAAGAQTSPVSRPTSSASWAGATYARATGPISACSISCRRSGTGS